MTRGTGRLAFQSAPLTGVRGDLNRTYSPYSLTEFQSAPLTGVRGDVVAEVVALDQLLFQSAPLTGVRGDDFEQLTSTIFTGFNPLPSLV